MMLGYDRDVYMLAFDHRGSFQKQLLGITGVPTREQAARITDTKALIFEGFLGATIAPPLDDAERGSLQRSASVLRDAIDSLQVAG